MYRGAMIFIVLAGCALAQTSFGTLNGSVSDSSGAAVPSALVLVTNVQTGASRSLTTDGAGNFTAPSLVPGLYSLTVEAKGFTKQIRSGGRLPVSETIHGPH